MAKIDQFLKNIGIEELNDMQNQFISASKKNSHLILASPTGTGKTVAFLVPILQQINLKKAKKIQALIIAPTRELVLQIQKVIGNMKLPIKSSSCYGGHPLKLEKIDLAIPPDILVATPGRLVDHLKRNNVEVANTPILVLDEFDKSLEFGFQDEMEFIIKKMHFVERKFLTSATDNLPIPDFVNLENPLKLSFLSDQSVKKRMDIKIVNSPTKDKLNTLADLLRNINNGKTLVFCNYRDSTQRIHDYLKQVGIQCDYFHGGLEQRDREKILIKFTNGSTNILITTDLASRGLDISGIKQVIHYHYSPKEEIYIHRNGRTARVNETGRIFLLIHALSELPDYVKTIPNTFHLKMELPNPEKPTWDTLYLSKGKKDKINKGDIAGFLYKNGGLERDELGEIILKEFFAYAAIQVSDKKQFLDSIRKQKLKSKSVKLYFV